MHDEKSMVCVSFRQHQNELITTETRSHVDLLGTGCEKTRHCTKHKTQGEEVGTSVERFTERLLERHISHGSERGSRAGSVGVLHRWFRCSSCRHEQSVCDFRQTKVEHLGMTTPGHKNVCGLDITVNDAARMCRLQAIRNLNRQR